MDDRLQFLDVHLHAAIAGKADDSLTEAGDGGADGRGQVVTHGGAAGVGKQGLTPF